MKLLVTGGARSGKSRYAQSRVEALGPRRTYLATGRALDAEMADRIRRHQADRGPGWRTVEEPLALAPALLAAEGPVLVDCLTLWLTNLMMAHGEDADLSPAFDELARAVALATAPLALVTNEVGSGIVPMNAMARRFCDLSGWLSQALAPVCDEVVLCVAGLPLHLKRSPPP